MAILGVNFKLKVLVLYPSDEDGEYILTNAMGLQRFWCIKYFCSAGGDGDIEVYNLVVQRAKCVQLHRNCLCCVVVKQQ